MTDFSEPIRQVWRGWYGTTLIGIAFLALLGLYGGILARSFEVLRRSSESLAVLSVAICGVLMVAVSAMYLLALRPGLIASPRTPSRSRVGN
jgi:hypothetical protein